MFFCVEQRNTILHLPKWEDPKHQYKNVTIFVKKQLPDNRVKFSFCDNDFPKDLKNSIVM